MGLEEHYWRGNIYIGMLKNVFEALNSANNIFMKTNPKRCVSY